VRLERLVVEGFRNLHGDGAPLVWLPHPRFNLLVGDNGQGKTNLLEAVAIVAGLRSFRAARLAECIAFDAARATVAANVVRAGVPAQIGVEWTARGRRMIADGKPAGAASAYLGRLTAVVFTPADLTLPHAEPEARRRWLDRVVFNHLPAHLDELRRYDQALLARNALLKTHLSAGGPVDLALLDVYDGLLARHGSEIVRRRREVIARFSPLVAATFGRIAAAGLRADIDFRPKIDGDEAGHLAGHAARRPRDLRVGYTTGGPHRDDVVLRIGDRPAHLHASQGQCRALVLSCKIAEIQSLERALGEPPVLLMDDVSSELDARRNAALLHDLDALGGQVVLTTTAAAHVRVAAPRQIFSVVAGKVTAGEVFGAGPAVARGSQPVLAFGAGKEEP